ncbi:MAG TPA: AraC family transcriptional regulator, partial [Holophaga sp.]|nr:AraC family transcriptional regulator [Holophaga sp.]
ASPRVAFSSLPLDRIVPNACRLCGGGTGERSVLICGGARLSGAAAHPLLAQLPEVLLVQKRVRAEFDWLRPTLEAMAHEVAHPRPGTMAVMTRLADILIVQAIRAWIASCRSADHGWLAALRDPQVGHSLALMHRQPGRAWDIEELAREVGMSRAVFAERFAALVGQPPKQYLTRWRMRLAGQWLQEEKVNLAQVAERLGYGSEAAFSRAFKRHHGASPGGFHRRPPAAQRSAAIL